MDLRQQARNAKLLLLVLLVLLVLLDITCCLARLDVPTTRGMIAKPCASVGQVCSGRRRYHRRGRVQDLVKHALDGLLDGGA